MYVLFENVNKNNKKKLQIIAVPSFVTLKYRQTLITAEYNHLSVCMYATAVFK